MIPRARHSDKLATEAVKIWADGGMSSRTAAIHGTYPVPPHGSGILYFERDVLTDMVRRLDALGFQVCIHAQGDRAIETVLDAYATVIDGPAGNHRRHRIEHGGAMYPTLTARAASMGIVMVSQPGFMSTLGDGFCAAFGDRADELYAFGSWRRAGLTVAGSSDAPVITADPLLGIRDAILRRTGEAGCSARTSACLPLPRSTCTPPRAPTPRTARPRSARWNRASSPTSWSWTPTLSTQIRSRSPISPSLPPSSEASRSTSQAPSSPRADPAGYCSISFRTCHAPSVVFDYMFQ